MLGYVVRVRFSPGPRGFNERPVRKNNHSVSVLSRLASGLVAMSVNSCR